jgi:ABC-type transport system involved in cytochrome c biogenesis permease subunit
MIPRLLLLVLLPICASAAEVAALPASAGEVPVLHQGRVKPLSVAAEEIVYSVTGYGRFGEVTTVEERGATRMDKAKTYGPTDLLMAWTLHADEWKAKPLLYAPYLPLQQAMGLKGQWATLAEAAGSPIVGEAVRKRERGERTKEKVDLSKTEVEAYALAERVQEARSALTGRELALMPLAPDGTARRWLLETLAPQLGDEGQGEPEWRGKLRDILGQPAEKRDQALRDADIWLTVGDLLADDPLLKKVDDQPLDTALLLARGWLLALRTYPAPPADERLALATVQPQLIAALRQQAARRAETPYPSAAKISAEVAYQRSHPFTWTWLCYILGGMLSAIGLARRTPEAGRRMFQLGVALTLIGVVFNVYGLGTRVYITSLGAVTNLYETLVYVALLCAGLGLIFARATRNGLYAVAGGIAGGLCAMVGEAIPPDLGSHIGQLQPVLRSKFWLWTHVKTVVASYAAFLLAWGLGNIVLIRAALQRRRVAAEESTAIYRSLQVGVVLIAAGTLLGAYWADQAWGRFWGWDPKEVWALVILLTYLIPLHLRYVGLVGPTGLAAWAVYGFMSVVMSWYGVNFLLGTGLHAYAFGTGGQGYVLSLCAVQLVVTTVALIAVLRTAPKAPAATLAEPTVADRPASAQG